MEYQNTHIRQLINPEKIFKMLELLRKSGNIHYQFYDDFNVYSARCRKDDSKGYNIIFDEETELIKDLTETNKNKEANKNLGNSKEEISIEEILENEYLKKDPVRRYQFEDYNK